MAVLAMLERIFLTALPFLFVLGVIALVFGFAFFGGQQRKRRRQENSGEETELIQELHKGLRRMEERVEALETLLTDRIEKSPPKYKDYLRDSEEHEEGPMK